MQSLETPIPNPLSPRPKVEPTIKTSPSREKFKSRRQQIAQERHGAWDKLREYKRIQHKFESGTLITEPKLYRQALEATYRSWKPLTLEQLEDLTDFEYQDLLQDVPPIKETFSPKKELDNLKALPKPERKVALKDFKDKFYRQNQSFATMQIYLERYVTNYPDIPSWKLFGVVHRFQQDYGYDETQVATAEQIIAGYYRYRNSALKWRKNYPNDLVLVYGLTDMDFRMVRGVKPSDIKVTVGPMSIDILATPDVLNMLYHRSYTPPPNFGYAGFAGKSGGVMYTVNPFDDTGTLKHEREHHKYKLLGEFFEVDYHTEVAEHWLSVFCRSFDPNSDGSCLAIAFREFRAVAFSKLKDEFFAMLKNHAYLLGDLPHWLNEFFTSGKYPPYDYLADTRNLPQSDPHPNYQEPIFQKLSQKILVDEYKKIMLKSCQAFWKLSFAYSRNSAQALLTTVPFELWPKTVKRILDAKLA